MGVNKSMKDFFALDTMNQPMDISSDNTSSNENTSKEVDSHFAYIISLMSGKGGVGKTGLAVNIGNYSSEFDKKVLLIDCDLYTQGATIFFGINNNINDKFRSNSILTTQMIMASILNGFELISDDKNGGKSRSDESFENFMEQYSCIKINRNFDFIPANLGNVIFQENELNSKTLLQVEEKLEKFFERLRNLYDIIILDCGAGYNSLNSLLKKYSDRICVVLENNHISCGATQRALTELFKNIDIGNVQCCINMLKNQEEKLERVGLLNEITGFTYDEEYSELYTKGNVINIDDSDLCHQLMEIVKKVYSDGESLSQLYSSKMYELMKQKRSEIRTKRRNLLYKVFFSILTLILSFQLAYIWEIIPRIVFAFIASIILSYILFIFLRYGIVKIKSKSK